MTVEWAVNIPSLKGYFQQLTIEEQHSLVNYMQEHDFVPDLLGIITSWESLA